MELGGSASRGLLPFLAINAVSEYYRLGRMPPVTASLVAANTVIYLRPGFLESIIPTIDEVWFNPHLIFKYTDLKRFLLSPFFHPNDSHLVYNMISLLWKGNQLEISVGSAEFATMVATLLGMSQGITLLLAKSLQVLNYKRPYYFTYDAGFSGILFGLKVILNYQSQDNTYVHGLLLPAKYAAWVELLLVQWLVPGVSFTTHLGGVLAGFLYLYLRDAYSGPNPLTVVMRTVKKAFQWPLRLMRRLFRRRRVVGRGTVGRGQRTWLSNTWRCRACTFENSTLLSDCEMCGASESAEVPPFRSPHGNLSLEELRLRRLQRFDR
ncbi:unnamed protein product [Rhodiola kirilowii]